MSFYFWLGILLLIGLAIGLVAVGMWSDIRYFFLVRKRRNMWRIYRAERLVAGKSVKVFRWKP